MSATHFDVLVIGAGISGIGMAHYVQERCPGKSFAILEGREELGGTWSLFKYPGIRCDSDMQTLGYRFKPWTSDKAITGADEILDYLRDAAHESRIDEHIRYSHRVTGADFDPATSRWTVSIHRADTGEDETITCGFLISCGGYYRYGEGYTPEFEGREDFRGDVVHPQHWPDDLDVTGKRIVVIGSGATAVTLVPALVEQGAAHVTQLQRSPTYVVPWLSEDPVAKAMRRVLPESLAYRLTRWKNVALMATVVRLANRAPNVLRKAIRAGARRSLPAGYPVDTHFRPSYDPWEQRLCVVPDGDFFKAIGSESADVVTDHVDRFTETGIRLRSGAHLDADVIVTATGLNMAMFDGIDLSVAGEKVEYPETVVYRSCMLTDVPNFAYLFGYTRFSWTLRVDPVSDFVARLLAHMDANGLTQVVPDAAAAGLTRRPLVDDFDANYMKRSMHLLPKQGATAPWELSMDYPRDRVAFARARFDDGTLRFSAAQPAAEPREPELAAAR